MPEPSQQTQPPGQPERKTAFLPRINDGGFPPSCSVMSREEGTRCYLYFPATQYLTGHKGMDIIMIHREKDLEQAE
jgi:hypothetical protein